jgi:hypothetical protein
LLDRCAQKILSGVRLQMGAPTHLLPSALSSGTFAQA